VQLAQYQKRHRGGDLGIGLQGGFGKQEIDFLQPYFGTALRYRPVFYLPFPESYFSLNGGVCYTWAANERFNYTIGLAANRINQPEATLKERTYRELGLGHSYSGIFSVNWQVRPKTTLRPSFYYLHKNGEGALIISAEVLQLLKNDPQSEHGATSLFAGLVQHTGEMAGLNAGVELHAFRLGAGYERSYAPQGAYMHGGKGIELTIKYIAPAHALFSRYRVVPSGIF
jgi:hypothetical protein